MTATATPAASDQMNNNGRDSLSSSANVPRIQDGTSCASGASNTPLSFLSWMDELRQDGSDASVITYSYYSTWSSNYTMSNLPGPGRLLGNLYSSVGSALERNLVRLFKRKVDTKALEKARRAEAEASAILRYSIPMMMSTDAREHEKACKVLLLCARSVGFPLILCR